MNNNLKIILIAVEVFVLVVLVLVGVGCQQRWIIVTGDGPRFDWYAVGEDLNVDIQKIPVLPNKPSQPTESAPDPTIETEPSATTHPSPVTPTPQPSEPAETTGPEETTEPDIPEDTTEDNRWGMGRF